MSNRIFQGLVHQMREAVGRPLGVIDDSGAIIACSELNKIGEIMSNSTDVFTDNEIHVVNGYTFCNFGTHIQSDYAVFVEGEDDIAARFATVCCVSLENLKQYYEEKFDRSNFIKNVILDNILPGDIYLKSRELHFNSEALRVVLLVRTTGHGDLSVIDSIQSIFPEKNRDFVININETDIAIVKEVSAGIEPEDVEKLARSVADTVSSEVYAHCLVGIGTIVTGVKEVARSFKEARIALEVGKVFDNEKTIVTYNNLGIARLIYQLPTTLCDMFLKEVFKSGSIDSLDHETLFTIQKFFENNLNVSETSRKLFVHRNTLVYRLEKIKKLTGLDLREFDDAIVFKVALMVKKYLDAKPVKY
ncbi:MAG: helix-turn-helix domain-containing protein [Clostridiales bacterium]|nr:helix-turn-helix domain-containing protein [Clostridiales bacterium]